MWEASLWSKALATPFNIILQNCETPGPLFHLEVKLNTKKPTQNTEYDILEWQHMLISPVIQDVMQQGCDGGALSGCLFIQETPGAILAHHKLLKHNTETSINPSAKRNWPSINLFNHCIYIYIFYLQRFIKPAVSTVGERPSSVQNLCCFTAGVSVNQRQREQKSHKVNKKASFSFPATSVLSHVSKWIHEWINRAFSQ